MNLVLFTVSTFGREGGLTIFELGSLPSLKINGGGEPERCEPHFLHWWHFVVIVFELVVGVAHTCTQWTVLLVLFARPKTWPVISWNNWKFTVNLWFSSSRWWTLVLSSWLLEHSILDSKLTGKTWHLVTIFQVWAWTQWVVLYYGPSSKFLFSLLCLYILCTM